MKRLLGLALLVSTGCGAHNMMRGSVVMKVSETDAHVCLGQGEVKKGDSIRLYRNICKEKVGAGTAATGGVPLPSCRKEAAGEGQVAETLNTHYSLVRFAPGIQFQEGDTVETLPR